MGLRLPARVADCRRRLGQLRPRSARRTLPSPRRRRTVNAIALPIPRKRAADQCRLAGEIDLYATGSVIGRSCTL